MLAKAPEAVERAFGRDTAHVLEVAPWLGILADSASSAGPGWRRRWRARWRLAPLLISKALLDRWFEHVEASWVSRRPASAEPYWMRLYVRLCPRSFPAKLRRDLESYASGDATGLRESLKFMSSLTSRLRRSEVPVAQETFPWIQKAAEYGRAGLWLLDVDPKRMPSSEERYRWGRRRLALRSLNGLESAPEQRFWIEQARAWRDLPAERRPKTLDVIYNPLQPL